MHDMRHTAIMVSLYKLVKSLDRGTTLKLPRKASISL